MIKHLIENDGTLYTVTGGTLVAVGGEIEADNFIDNGFDSVIGIESLIQSLSSPTIHTWSDIQRESTTVEIDGMPSPQSIITMEVNIATSDIISIQEITASYTGTPLIAISFNNGQYMQYNGNTHLWEQSENYGGMTIQTLQDISEEEWTETFTDVTTMRLRATLTTTDDTISQLQLTYLTN